MVVGGHTLTDEPVAHGPGTSPTVIGHFACHACLQHVSDRFFRTLNREPRLQRRCVQEIRRLCHNLGVVA
jgi:hypothetical protein